MRAKYTAQEIYENRLEIQGLTPIQFEEVRLLFVKAFPDIRYNNCRHSGGKFHRFFPSSESRHDEYGASDASYAKFREDHPRKAYGTITYEEIDLFNGEPEVSMDEIREAAKAYGINFNF